MLEKDLALKLAKAVKGYLEAEMSDWEVYLTRDSDRHVSLQERCDIANYHNADIFVSIHLNGADSPQAHGVEVYHYPNSEKGHLLAQSIHDYMAELLAGEWPNWYDRGIKTAEYYVLKHTKMPAVLVEAGFITNDNDARFVADNIDLIATAIAGGIREYFNGRR
jgi:N-acetylmuramoyl-L-alanine amidase